MKTIEENNILIAKFLGAEMGNGTKDFPNVLINVETPLCKSGSTLASVMLKYDSSWDWLMMVIEKINTFDYFTCHSTMKSIGLSIPDIELAYGYVVEFVIWYNDSHPS